MTAVKPVMLVAALSWGCSDAETTAPVPAAPADDEDHDHDQGDGPLGDPAQCPAEQTLTYESFGQAFFARYCTRCHSSSVAGDDRNDAPVDMNFDTLADIRRHGRHIDDHAGMRAGAAMDLMPPDDPLPSDAERKDLSEWLACRAPSEACANGGGGEDHPADGHDEREEEDPEDVREPGCFCETSFCVGGDEYCDEMLACCEVDADCHAGGPDVDVDVEPEKCDNGVDDDADGQIDCLDDACDGDQACASAGACGDGVLDAGEDCDDGGIAAGDGCSARCRVESPDGGGDGPNDDPQRAQELEAGGEVVGGLDEEGDDDWYSIQLEEGDTLTAETGDGAGGCATDTIVFVYDQAPDPVVEVGLCGDDPAAVACDDDGGEATCSLATYAATEAGLHLVRVAGYGDTAVGDYVLTLTVVHAGDGGGGGLRCDADTETEPNEWMDEADPICDGSVLDAEIGRSGDDDWYVVVLEEGQTLVAETSDGGVGCATDTVIVVYPEGASPLPNTWSCDDDPEEIACDDDGAGDVCSRLSFTAPGDGTYYLRVIEWDDDGTGPYTLDVSID